MTRPAAPTTTGREPRRRNTTPRSSALPAAASTSSTPCSATAGPTSHPPPPSPLRAPQPLDKNIETPPRARTTWWILLSTTFEGDASGDPPQLPGWPGGRDPACPAEPATVPCRSGSPAEPATVPGRAGDPADQAARPIRRPGRSVGLGQVGRAEPLLGAHRRPDVIKPEQRRPGNGRDVHNVQERPRGAGRQPGRDAVRQHRIPRGQQAAAEYDRHCLPGQAKAADHRDRHGHDLVGEPRDHLARYLVAAGCRAQQYGRQPEQLICGNLAVVDADADVAGRGHAEMGGHGLAEHRLRATAVLIPDGPPEGFPAEALPAAPVAGYLAKGRKPGLPPVRRHRDAVDAGAARHGHPPVPDLAIAAEQPIAPGGTGHIAPGGTGHIAPGGTGHIAPGSPGSAI